MRPRQLVVATSLLACLVGCRNQGDVARLPEKVVPAGLAGPSLSAAQQEKEGGARILVLSGALEPHRRATLKPRVGGPVAKVHVREGDVVKAGDALVSIDPEQYALVAQQAEAGLAGAQVQLDAATLELERQKALLAQKASPQSMYDLVEARYKGAAVGVRAAEVGLAQARKAQRDATVRAPFGAIVTRKLVSEGDMATSMPPTDLVTLEECDTLDLRVHVPAVNLDQAVVGAPVKVRFLSGQKEVDARISRVVRSINPGTRTFPVFVEIDNSQGHYLSGLFAEVRLGAPAAGQGATPEAGR